MMKKLLVFIVLPVFAYAADNIRFEEKALARKLVLAEKVLSERGFGEDWEDIRLLEGQRERLGAQYRGEVEKIDHEIRKLQRDKAPKDAIRACDCQLSETYSKYLEDKKLAEDKIREFRAALAHVLRRKIKPLNDTMAPLSNDEVAELDALNLAWEVVVPRYFITTVSANLGESQ